MSAFDPKRTLAGRAQPPLLARVTNQLAPIIKPRRNYFGIISAGFFITPMLKECRTETRALPLRVLIRRRYFANLRPNVWN
jgi:hypothetical protein